MSEETLTLVSPDGEETTVQVGDTAGNEGRINELIQEGYQFHPDHADRTIEVYGIMPGESSPSRGTVSIAELQQLRNWHQESYNQDIRVIEDDIRADRELRSVEAAEDRRDRVAAFGVDSPVEAAGYGVLQSITGGLAVPTIRAFGELSDSHELGRRIEEVTEANPLSSLSGGILGYGLVRSALGRGVNALSSSVTPGVSRSFSRQAAQTLSGGQRLRRNVLDNLAEEIYFEAAMSGLREQPTLSAETIAAGTAFGTLIGLPFMRGSGNTAMRGVTPQTPGQQVVSAGRQTQDQAQQAAQQNMQQAVQTSGQGTPARSDQPRPLPTDPGGAPGIFGTFRKMFSSIPHSATGNSPSLSMLENADFQHNLRIAQDQGRATEYVDEAASVIQETLARKAAVDAEIRSYDSAADNVYIPAINQHRNSFPSVEAASEAQEAGLRGLVNDIDGAQADIQRLRSTEGQGDARALGANDKDINAINDILTNLRGYADTMSRNPVDFDMAALHRQISEAYTAINDIIHNSGTTNQTLLAVQSVMARPTGNNAGGVMHRHLGANGDPGKRLFGETAINAWTRRNELVSRAAEAEEWLVGRGNTVGALGLPTDMRVGGSTVSTKRLKKYLSATDENEMANFLELLQEKIDGINTVYEEVIPKTAGTSKAASKKAQMAIENFSILARTMDIYKQADAAARGAMSQWGFATGPLGGVSAGFVGGGLIGGPVGGLLGAAGMMAIGSLARPHQAAAFKGRVATAMNDFTTRSTTGLRGVKKKLKLTNRALSPTGRTVRGAAAVGFGQLVGGSPRERAEEYHRIQAELRELQSNPQMLANNLEMSTSALAEVNPEAAAAMNELAVRGLNYLISTSPPVASDPLFPGRMAAPPSQSAIDDFVKRYRAIHDPTVVLSDFANNTLSQATVDTVRAVYPGVFSGYQAAMGDILSEINPDTLPYQTRMSLSTFLGSRTDITLSSDFVMAMQGRSAQTPQQASAQGMERMPARRINVSTSFLTEGQSLERMK